jgi:hypothetical protein
LNNEDFGVVDQPVDHGANGDGAAEDLGPGGEGFVGADDEAGPFIAAGDDREEMEAASGSKRM